jgi:cytochrome c oxidase assembly protein subunit 15
VLFAGVLTLAQILVGALVRHTGSGRVCGTDWVACGQTLWPDFHPAQLHMTHRFLGYLLFVVVLVVSVTASRKAREHGKTLARKAALLTPLVAVLQVVLGLLTVASGVGIWEAMGHLGGGALLLAVLMVTYLGLGSQVDRVSIGASK